MAMTLHEKLSAVQSSVGSLYKDGKNPFFQGHKYATLDNIIQHLRPYLMEHLLQVLHFSDGVSVITVVKDLESDDEITSSLPIPENLRNDPQKIGSAITYYRRYNLAMLFDLVFDTDDDGNAASGKVTPAQRPTPQTTKPAVTTAATPEETRTCEVCASPMKFNSGVKKKKDKDGNDIDYHWKAWFCSSENRSHTVFIK